MSSRTDSLLQTSAIDLPALASDASDVPFVRIGNHLYVTGRLRPSHGDRRFVGKVGRDFSVEEGQEAARYCGVRLIENLKRALDGDLNQVLRFVRLAGFVNSAPGFTAHGQVVNGASDLFVQVFGDAGRHSRVAVGVAALANDVAVELEASLEVR